MNKVDDTSHEAKGTKYANVVNVNVNGHASYVRVVVYGLVVVRKMLRWVLVLVWMKMKSRMIEAWISRMCWCR